MDLKLTRSELLWNIRALEVAEAQVKCEGNETLAFTFHELRRKYEQAALSGPTVFELKQAP